MVIETFGLTKVYPGGGGCRDISLVVGDSEVFGFLGPNGAGKSTFVKTLVGLIAPTSGSANILGRPLGDVRSREKIGFLPENFRYHSWLTAKELLVLHGKLAGMDQSAIKARIPEVLELVHLSGSERKTVGNFSKGMQQRLGLAVALLPRPRLLFLDEPTSALDPVGRMEVRELIRFLRSEGTTVFLNSHLLGEVERVCNRVGIIKDGAILAVGALQELLQNAREVEMEVEPVSTGLLEAIRPLVRSMRCDGNRITARVETRETIPLLAQKVLEAGSSLYSLEPRGSTLEDVFLQMMEGEGDGA